MLRLKKTNWNSRQIISKNIIQTNRFEGKEKILGIESEFLKTAGLSCYFYMMEP